MAPPLASCDFPESQIRFATSRTTKGPSITSGIAPRGWRRSKHSCVVRTLDYSLIALTRRLFLLTGPHTSTALRPLLPRSGGPDQGLPLRGPLPSAVAKDTGAFHSDDYGLPHSHLLEKPQPTQWKRQFLNFFGCPGSTAPPLPGLSRRVASRRLRKLTAPSARASQSQ